MKVIELNLPDDVYEKLQNLASHDHQPVNVFALRKLEEFARAVEAFTELEQRARQGDRQKFLTAMDRVPDNSSTPGDAL